MFTELLSGDDSAAAVPTMLARVSNQLREQLPPSEFKHVNISLHAYPERYQRQLPDQPSNPTLYPDHSSRDRSRKTALMIKRVMDVAGSLLAMLVVAPLFAAIAIAIKLNSGGPVLFLQQRIGQHGRTFVLYKFRSMYDNSDASVHKQWFNKFLTGEGQRYPTNGNKGHGSFKMTNDPRVTRVGRILRRASLDELPQFLSVLKGDMSLVGPRPPIPTKWMSTKYGTAAGCWKRSRGSPGFGR